MKSMKGLLVKQYGWPLKLDDCPDGLIVIGETLCVKTPDGEIFAESGAPCWGGNRNHPERFTTIAQPAKVEWQKIIIPGEDFED